MPERDAAVLPVGREITAGRGLGLAIDFCEDVPRLGDAAVDALG